MTVQPQRQQGNAYQPSTRHTMYAEIIYRQSRIMDYLTALWIQGILDKRHNNMKIPDICVIN